jgi:hypothetical protein
MEGHPVLELNERIRKNEDLRRGLVEEIHH